MEAGVSLCNFLEERYGPGALMRFWRSHLDPARHRDPKTWSEAFGKTQGELQREWLAFYGVGRAP